MDHAQRPEADIRTIGGTGDEVHFTEVIARNLMADRPVANREPLLDAPLTILADEMIDIAPAKMMHLLTLP